MAAPKAYMFRGIDFEACIVTMLDGEGHLRRFPFGELDLLAMTHLQVVASRLGVGQPKGSTKAQVLVAIGDVIHNRTSRFPDWYDKWLAIKEGGEDTTPPKGEATEATVPEGDGLTDEERAVLEAIRRPKGVTEDQVLAIATKVAEEMVAKMALPTTTVVVRDRIPPKDLGRKTHAMLQDALDVLSEGLRPMLIGPAGSGKSVLAEDLAEVLGVPYVPVPLHSAMMMAEVVGFKDAKGEYDPTPLREAYEEGGVIVWEEMDGCHPSVMVGQQALIANKYFTFPDGKVKQSAITFHVATANTWGTGPTAEYIGRTKLDAATIDRFVAVPCDYDLDLEVQVGESRAGEAGRMFATAVQGIRKNIDNHALRVVCGMRSIQAAGLLLKGWSADKVLEATVFRNLPADQRGKCLQGIDLKSIDAQAKRQPKPKRTLQAATLA